MKKCQDPLPDNVRTKSGQICSNQYQQTDQIGSRISATPSPSSWRPTCWVNFFFNYFLPYLVKLDAYVTFNTASRTSCCSCSHEPIILNELWRGDWSHIYMARASLTTRYSLLPHRGLWVRQEGRYCTLCHPLQNIRRNAEEGLWRDLITSENCRLGGRKM